MSQRLLITSKVKKNQGIYDAIITRDTNSKEIISQLLKNWLSLAYIEIKKKPTCFTVGPWTIRIEDIELYKKLEKLLGDIFDRYIDRRKFGKYPKCLFRVFLGKNMIEHPTKNELNILLRKEIE